MMGAMRKAIFAAAACCLFAAGCAGTTPSLGHRPERGLASVLIGGRIVLPTGETRYGRMWINFEGEGGTNGKGNGEVYRFEIQPGQPILYQVEPDAYHLAPTRNVFGGRQPRLEVVIEGRAYYADFPRAIQRKGAVTVPPSKIVALGVLEAKLAPGAPGRPPQLSLWFDDGPVARRKLSEDIIRAMMDPEAPASYRNNAVEWSRALQQSLLDITEEPAQVPLFKRPKP
jgi:hypothetical protein